MPAQLVITDVTRMSGSRVCIAGVDKKKRNIRPVFKYHGIEESWLYDGDQAIIKPFAKVGFQPIGRKPQPPHTEDCLVRDNFKQFLGSLGEDRRLKFTQSIVDPDVQSVFGAEVHYEKGHGYFVCKGEGVRSLGTVQAKINGFSHRKYKNWDYRLFFEDSSNHSYGLKITDLSFRYYVDDLRENQEISPGSISLQILRTLQDSDVYLRIGLTRPTWELHPDCCHLQVTGVYTFPDYLDGRCFADFNRQLPN